MGNGDHEIPPRPQAVSNPIARLKTHSCHSDSHTSFLRLRRAFILIDSEHGIKQKDADILGLFRRYAIPHQIILSKVDKVLAKKKKQVMTGVSAVSVQRLQTMLRDLRPVIQPDPRLSEGPGALGEILTCSAEVPIGPGRVLGGDAVRWAILSAAGIDGSLEGGQPAPDITSTSTSTADLT